MDRHRLAVIVEDDDLKEPADSVCSDVEVTIVLAHDTDSVANCVLNILVGNTVLAGVVRDLHTMQVTLHTSSSASYVAPPRATPPTRSTSR